jgi:hypothetical protein
MYSILFKILISFVKNVLRLLSMLSLQQQSNIINNNNNSHLSSANTMMPPMVTQSSQQQQQQQQQENQYDRSSVNSQQQGLADKIQAVRHLWESENQYPNSSQLVHQIPNYNQQQSSSIVDPGIYNHMNTTFQQATQGFIQYQ